MFVDFKHSKRPAPNGEIPTLGRFVEADPIGYEDSPNLYAYVLNDPVNLIDPLGLGIRESCRTLTGYVVGGSGSTTRTFCTYMYTPDPIIEQRREGGGPGGPGRAAGSKVTVKLPEVQPSLPCSPTPQQLANSGEVRYQFTEGTLTRGLLSSHLEGAFVTSKGFSGRFETQVSGVFVGAGIGSIAEGKGISENLATFSGVNYNIVGQLGPLAISDNFSTSGSHVGQTDAGSTPGLGIGGTVSETRLKSVFCPPRS